MSRAPSSAGAATWRRGLVAVTAAAALLAAGPAGAQTPDRADGRTEVELQVRSFTGVLLPGGEFRLRARVRNSGDEELDGLRLLGTLHTPPDRRLDFQRAVDDGRVGGLWESFSADVDPLAPGSAQTVDVTRSAAELGFRRPADQYGVYPVRVQIQQAGAAVAEVRTSVVLAPEQVDEPVRVAVLLPIDAPPSRQADGTYAPDHALRSISTGGRLASLIGNAAGAQPVPVTVATSGLLLEQVADAAQGHALRRNGELEERAADSPAAGAAGRFLEQLSGLSDQAGVEQVALPYGPADLVALVRHGMPGEAVRLISEGQAASERHTGSRPLPRVLWPPDGLDSSTLAQIVDVETVILSERYLETRLPTFSPSPVRRLRGPAGPPVQVLVPDPWLEDVLSGDWSEHGRAVAAQRVLAETAAMYFERPNTPDRGLLIAPPLLWDPPRGMLRDLLDAARDAPWLEPVTLSELTAEVARDANTVELAYPNSARSRELGASYVASLGEARRALGSLAGVLDPDDDTPVRFDRLLLTAASAHYRGGRAGEGRELIAAVAGTVGDLYDAVRVVEGPVVTLAGTEGRLPVTLASDADIPVRVQVRFLGPRYEFDPPVLREVLLDPGETRTVAVDATALSPGGIAGIRVRVEDADGLLELAEGTVVVRSTGMNIVALIVTVGAGVFLIAWWGREARRRRDEAAAEAERAAAA